MDEARNSLPTPARDASAGFIPWAIKNLAPLRAEYQAELDAGEFVDWTYWLCDRWAREQLEHDFERAA